MLDSIKRLILGVEHDPRTVALVRAVLLYLLPIGVGALAVTLAAVTDPRWAWLVGLVPFLRVAEGIVLDQLRKPYQNLVNPPPVSGQETPPAVPPA